MKTALVSARFETKDITFIEEVAKDEKADKTTALKKIFSMGVKQYKLEKAIKQYQAGKISIGKAAETAGISLWEIMEELKQRNIPNTLTKDDYQEGLKNIRKIWK